MGRQKTCGKITVLQSFPVPRETTNPYITMLWQSLSNTDGLATRTFSWREALLGHYDVFHIHWPEILVTGRTPLRKVIRQILFVLLLLRLRLARIAVVRTVHNLSLPTGISALEIWLLKAIDARTDYRIVLNSSTELPPHQPRSLVVHGHYRGWFARYTKSVPVPGRICYFGLIRQYKGVDRLVTAFRQTEEPGLSLHVTGRPSSGALERGLAHLAADDQRICLRLRFQSDSELTCEVSESELVVFPYTEMHNSGGVLAALSLNRPVLVPDNAVTRKLGQEVGPGWIYTYNGELTGRRITEILGEVHTAPKSSSPNLDARDWTKAGSDHVAAYRKALALTIQG